MTRLTGTDPHFHFDRVVLPLGNGDAHDDMVEQLRRTAWRHYEEEHPIASGGQLSSSVNTT